MMRARRAFGAFQRAGAVFCGCLLTVFTGLVLYSVLMRYMFNAPPIWGEEMPRLFFVWMIFIGAAFAYFSGQNIRMTAIIDKVPPRPRRMIELGMHVSIVVVLLVILWYSPPILNLASRTQSIATGISDWWKFIALPVGVVLLLINEVWRIARILRGHADDPVDMGANG